MIRWYRLDVRIRIPVVEIMILSFGVATLVAHLFQIIFWTTMAQDGIFSMILDVFAMGTLVIATGLYYPMVLIASKGLFGVRKGCLPVETRAVLGICSFMVLSSALGHGYSGMILVRLRLLFSKYTDC